MLHAYKEWGERCFERFSGMFAFALYDSNTDTVVLARDQFGKKPLYYTQRDGHILFASELKALASVCTRLEPNHQRIAEWSLYRNVDFGSSDTLVCRYFLPAAGAFHGNPRAANGHATALLCAGVARYGGSLSGIRRHAA